MSFHASLLLVCEGTRASVLRPLLPGPSHTNRLHPQNMSRNKPTLSLFAFVWILYDSHREISEWLQRNFVEHSH